MTSVFQTAVLVAVAFMLASSQILLKHAVVTVQAGGYRLALIGMLMGLLARWQFWAAIVVSGCVMLIWAWVLTVVPLSKSYPFTVLAFVFAAMMDSVFFGERLTVSFFGGCALILAGLLVIGR